jgi:hypothetical protein
MGADREEVVQVRHLPPPRLSRKELKSKETGIYNTLIPEVRSI